jgi:hypothetical protein
MAKARRREGRWEEGKGQGEWAGEAGQGCIEEPQGSLSRPGCTHSLSPLAELRLSQCTICSLPTGPKRATQAHTSSAEMPTEKKKN